MFIFSIITENILDTTNRAIKQYTHVRYSKVQPRNPTTDYATVSLY